MDTFTVKLLDEAHAGAAGDYLARRPIDSVFLRGLIRDNGLRSPRNRGDFYLCLDGEEKVVGLALCGHAILVEADDDAVADAFSNLARLLPAPRLIRGARGIVERFWNHYDRGRDLPHCLKTELLLVKRPPADECEPVPGLRLATPDDLSALAEVNAGLLVEGGRVSIRSDAEGFRRRLAERVGRGRVWVLKEGGRLIFKTDILAETPDTVYLEGVYVHPDERGRGVGLRCLSQLTGTLLRQATSVCLTVNTSNEAGLALYGKAGFSLHREYATLHLREGASAARKCA